MPTDDPLLIKIDQLLTKVGSDQTQELLICSLDFVVEVATGSHDDLCPLNHPAYRGKWCNCCEAIKLIDRLAEIV